MTDDLPSLQNSPEPRTSFKKHTWGLAVGSSFAIITDLSITLNRNCTWYPISHPLCSKKKNPKNQFSSKWFGTIYGYSSEKAMALHSSTLAWKIPWTEEPGGLQSMGPHRVGHDWSDLAAAASWTFLLQERVRKIRTNDLLGKGYKHRLSLLFIWTLRAHLCVCVVYVVFCTDGLL